VLDTRKRLRRSLIPEGHALLADLHREVGYARLGPSTATAVAPEPGASWDYVALGESTPDCWRVSLHECYVNPYAEHIETDLGVKVTMHNWAVSGRPITTTGGHCWPMGGQADGVEGVQAAVRELVEEGANWIKVMASGGDTKGTNPHQPSYTTEELKAIVQEAHSYGKLVGVHSLCVAGTVRLLDAGVDMIIHGYFYDGDGTYRFDPDVAARIADTGTWFNPTLHLCRSRIRRLRQLAETRGLSEDERANLAGQERYWVEKCDAFQRLLRAGVRLAAGSDSGWDCYPFGLFAEEVDRWARQARHRRRRWRQRRASPPKRSALPTRSAPWRQVKLQTCW